MQDMIVEEIRKEMIFLGETVMQVRALSLFNKISGDSFGCIDMGT